MPVATFGPAFSKRLAELEGPCKLRGEWVLAMMASEAGFNPRAKNSMGFQGLTQIGTKELKALGYDEAKRGPYNMADPVTQLEFGCKFWEEWRLRLKLEKWENRAHLYQCNFMPMTAAGPFFDAEVLIDRAKWALGWKANAGLDANKDGLITAGEMELHMSRSVRALQARYDAEVAALEAARGGTVPTAHIDTWKDCQAALKDLGLYAGAIDGIPGELTLRAVAALLHR